MGMSVPSLHRESTDSLMRIVKLFIDTFSKLEYGYTGIRECMYSSNYYTDHTSLGLLCTDMM